MGRQLIILLLAIAMLGSAPSVMAQDIEQRLERIERLLRSDSLLAIDRVQQQLLNEFADFRNDLELMNRQVRELQQEQRRLYQELDARTRTLEQLLIADGDEDSLAEAPFSGFPDDLEFDEPGLSLPDLPSETRESAVTDVDDPLGALIQQRGLDIDAPPVDEADEPDTADQTIMAPSTVDTPIDQPEMVDARSESTADSTVESIDSAIVDDDDAVDEEALASDYERAFGFLQDGNHERASTAFSRIIDEHPDSHFAADARFWLAESHYIVREFDAAEEHFQVVVETGSDARRAEALMKLGFIQYERGQWQEARTLLQQVVDQHPGTTSALLARDRLSELQAAGR